MRALVKTHLNGAIAQLGERNTGSVEVSGSIPLSSTKYKNPQACLGVFSMCLDYVFAELPSS